MTGSEIELFAAFLCDISDCSMTVINRALINLNIIGIFGISDFMDKESSGNPILE